MDLRKNVQFHTFLYGVRRNNIMKLSIIMPAYNAGKTISMAVNSVVEILSNDVELIIVDDGSTDDTAEICSIYQEKYQTI